MGPIGFRPHSRLVALWLRLGGEPFRWSATDAEVRELLHLCGWSLLQQVRCECIAQDLGLSVGQELRGENIFLAQASPRGAQVS